MLIPLIILTLTLFCYANSYLKLFKIIGKESHITWNRAKNLIENYPQVSAKNRYFIFPPHFFQKLIHKLDLRKRVSRTISTLWLAQGFPRSSFEQPSNTFHAFQNTSTWKHAKTVHKMKIPQPLKVFWLKESHKLWLLLLAVQYFPDMSDKFSFDPIASRISVQFCPRCEHCHANAITPLTQWCHPLWDSNLCVML